MLTSPLIIRQSYIGVFNVRRLIMESTRAKRALSTSINTESSPTKKKVQSSTTKSAVANFFKPASQKEPEPTTWRVMDGSLLIAKYTKPPSTGGEKINEKDESSEPLVRNKVAGFDLDGTLIKTLSGNKFARTETDWQWWDASVPKKLKSLYEEGYQIVIFTNQGGLKEPKKESVNLRKFKLKVAAMLNALQVPLMLYAATGNDKYRKPRSGMWDEMVDDLDFDVYGVQLKHSYLVGDAAGREGDFSDSDRHWAMNIGIDFYTPESFFLGEEPKPMVSRFDPSRYIIDTEVDEASEVSPKSLFAKSEKQEVVVFVGSPGAGKSTFYRRNLEPLGYERINQDTLKSREKCLRVAREFLGQGKSVAVDNTNADVATRALWLQLARDHKVGVRCVYFTAPPELSQHNDAVRAFGGELVNPEKRVVLPKLAFSGYISRFKEPSTVEGFETVTKVDFQWQGEEAERKIWSRYWI